MCDLFSGNSQVDHIEWKYLNEEQKYKFYYDGRIWSCISNKFLSPYFDKTKNKYFIKLSIKGESLNYSIHTLFYKLFKEEIKKGNIISFKDGNHGNFHIDNLIQVPKFIYNLEEWKDIPGYEERYVVNKEGQLKTLIGNKAGKIREDKYHKKYKQSCLKHLLIDKEGNKKIHRLHNLIWITFNGPILDEMIIYHINKDKFDNRLENLKLETQSEHMKHITMKPQNIKDIPILDYNFENIGVYKEFDFSKYEVNKDSQIRNLKGMLMCQRDENEYKIIKLTDKISKKEKTVKVHQIVASIFIPNPNNFPQVNHKDKCRWNNHISNLEWVDAQKQMIHARGKKVGQYTLDGQLIATFESISEAVKSIGKNNLGNIGKVCNKKQETAYGFIWKWID